MIVLGVDPGTRNPGIALIERRLLKWHLLDAPVLGSDDDALEYLLTLADVELRCIAVEEVAWSALGEKHLGDKVQKNATGGRILELPGALRLLAKQKRIPLVRLMPASWRKLAAGHGRASKEQVRDVLRRQVTGIPKVFGLNRSDALAIGIAGTRSPGFAHFNLKGGSVLATAKSPGTAGDGVRGQSIGGKQSTSRKLRTRAAGVNGARVTR